MKAIALTLALLPLNRFHANEDVSRPPATQPAAHASEQGSARGRTVSVRRGTLTQAIDADGYFEPVDPTEVRIRPKAYAGELTIKTVVADGSAVKQGQVLLELDPEAIDRQISAAENDAASSHAALTKLQADDKVAVEQEALGLRMQVDATRRAEDEVKWWKTVDGPNLLAQAELALKNARASVEDQQDELNELKKMYKTDDLSTDTADIVVKRAVRNLENSKVVLKMQEEHSDKVKTFAYPAQEQQVLDAAKQAEYQLQLVKNAQAQNRVVRDAGLRTAEANTGAFDRRLADLRADKQKLTVRAPADGVVFYGQFVNGGFQGVSDRSLRVGENVAAQQVVMTFYTPGKLRLRLDLPESKFFALKAGTRVGVTPVSYPDAKREGTCDACPALTQNTQQGPQYALTIDCGSVDPRVVPGMRAHVRGEAEIPGSVLLVPTSAIADGSVRVVSDDGRCERRKVTVGKSDDKFTEIKQGLSEGEQVLVEAQK